MHVNVNNIIDGFHVTSSIFQIQNQRIMKVFIIITHNVILFYISSIVYLV